MFINVKTGLILHVIFNKKSFKASNLQVVKKVILKFELLSKKYIEDPVLFNEFIIIFNDKRI
jgi:hypothetical protein